jgi:hypothetical protein
MDSQPATECFWDGEIEEVPSGTELANCWTDPLCRNHHYVCVLAVLRGCLRIKRERRCIINTRLHCFHRPILPSGGHKSYVISYRWHE